MPGFTLRPRGRFSLHASATFAEGFPGTEADRESGELRFAWAVDGDWRAVAVKLSCRGDSLRGELEGAPPRDLARLARRDVERILSLDVDGAEFERVGGRDPVIGQLQRRYAGLRPVLFYSPYEAAAWTIIGQRIRIVQAAAVKRRLTDELGSRRRVPRSRRPGHAHRSAARAHDPQDRPAPRARRGRAGRDPDARAATGPRLLATRSPSCSGLPGIGPFSSELIMIRGVGAPDALPANERRVERAIRAAYGLAADAELGPVTDAWRPYRSWCALLLRRWLETETQEIATGRRATGDPPPIV